MINRHSYLAQRTFAFSLLAWKEVASQQHAYNYMTTHNITRISPVGAELLILEYLSAVHFWKVIGVDDVFRYYTVRISECCF